MALESPVQAAPPTVKLQFLGSEGWRATMETSSGPMIVEGPTFLTTYYAALDAAKKLVGVSAD